MLQPKYAKQLDSNIKELLANGGSNEDVEKMASDYTSLFSDEALKKKDKSDVTATPQKLVSETSTGSLDGVGSNDFGESLKTILPNIQPKIEPRDMNSKDAYNAILQRDANLKKSTEYGKSLNDRVIPKKELPIIDKDTELRNQIIRKIQPLADQATTITDADLANIESDYNKELNNSGFQNTFKSAIASVVNPLARAVAEWKETPNGEKRPELINTDNPLKKYEDMAVEEATKENKKITPEEKTARAKELFFDNRKSEIIQSRLNDVNHSLTDDEQKIIKNDRFDKIHNLGKENKSLLKNIPILVGNRDETIKDIEDTYHQILDLHKANQPIPEDLKNKFETLQNRGQRYDSELNSLYQKYNSNKKDLGTFKQEYDVYKTENNRFLNGVGRLGNALIGMGGEALDFGAYIANASSTLPHNEVAGGISQLLHAKANDFHKQVEDNSQYLQHTSSVEDASDFIDKTLDFTIDNISMVTALTLTGGVGVAGMAATTAGAKYGEMANEDKSNYSQLQKTIAPALYGATMVAPMLTQLNTIRNGARVMETIATESPELLQKSLLKKSEEILTKYIPKHASSSFKLANELKGMEFLQEGVNHFVLGKDIDYKKLADAGVYETAPLLHAMNVVAPHLLMAETKPFMSVKEVEQLDNNSKKLFDLYGKLQDPKLDKSEKAILQSTIDAITKDSQDLVKGKINGIANTPKPLVDALINVTQKSSDLRAKAIRVNSADNSTFSPEQKKVILDNLKNEYRENEKERIDILQGNKTVVDVLPLKEQDKLKKTALKELTAELNPDGTKNIEIDNAQIVERANKIYSKQLKDAEAKTPTPEAQPQAEKQAEVVEVETPKADSVGVGGDVKQNLGIKRGKNGFEGDFLNDYELIGEGSEHTVYRKKGSDKVIRLSEPYSDKSETTFNQRVRDAKLIDEIVGDGSLNVIGYYESENGTKNPIYEQNFQDSKPISEQEVEAHLRSIGGIEYGDKYNRGYLFNHNGKWYKINDYSDNFFKDKNGKIVAIDAAIVPISDVEINKARENDADFNKAVEQSLKETPQAETNEKPQEVAVAETQPQTEVPQQAEAEKVNTEPKNTTTEPTTVVSDNKEVSPVEDVVATSVEKKQPTNAKEWEEQNFTKDEIEERRKFGLTPEQEWEPTFRGTSLSEWEDIQKGGDFKSEGLNGLVFTTPSAELAKQSGKGVDAEVIIEFKPESKSKMREGDSKYDSKEYYGDGLNKEDVLRVTDKNGNVIYEATPPTNTPTNGNVQLGTSNVGESGITEQQSPAKENLPSSVDGGESKGVIEVETKKIKGKKLTFYKIDGYDIDSGFAVEKNKDGYIIQSALIPFAKQRQGIGTDFYIRMNNESIEKTGKPLKSSDNLSNSNGKPFWEKLVLKGYAEKTGENNYKFKDKKTVTLPNLDDIADFINQTYLNDGKQETKPGETNPTAESNKGTSENSVQENPSVSKGAKKGKQKEIKLDKNGYVIISKKGKTPLNQRKFKGDRKEAASIEPTDAQSLVLSYFANGGKIASAFFSSKGELKARNNGFNGIATKNAQGIDAIAHLLWESQQNKTLKLDTGEIKDAIENVVNSHNNVNDIVSTLLKNYELKEQEYPQDIIDYHQAIQEAQNEENANEEEAQEVFSSLDQLSEAEIIELAESQDKSYEDYLKDLEKRQVTYDFGPFSEQGTIQPDGWILSENGDLLSPESVSNVKQVNPDIETKKPISKDTPELKEVNAKLEKANENLRIAKDALDRKAKSLDKELLKDAEDLFGVRKSQSENKLFDERVDADARNKATEKERKAISDAQNEIKSLKEVKAKIESGEVKSTKELAFEEVDKYVQKIKDILPGINDPDLNKQGISQDDLIDLVASAVKTLVSKGIDINDAIRQVISSIKQRFNVDVDEKLVKEKLGVEKPKSKNKNPLREKSSEEIADELGISHDDYLDLKGLVANEPSSGIFNEYLSAETIADVFGDSPTNDQQYEQMVLLNAVQHGNSVLEKARSIFGENYMSKTLEFLQNVKLGNFEKAMVYAALENEIDTLVKANPSNKVFLATQRLIYADSQANLRNSSKGLNAGRLRRIHNAIKNGYDVDKVTSGLIKPEQQEAKQILKDAIPTGDNLNKASEQEENTEIEKPRVYTQEEFEAELKKAVQASVGKSRNELSKKGKDIADKIRRLKLNKDVAKADLSLGAYDLAIEAIAQLVEKGATVAQAIKNVLSDVKYKDIDADKLRQDILGVVNTPRIKDVVKQALIDAGFSREITVTKNAKDANGNDIIDSDGKKQKVKETKEVLDWNKLTGRMNSVEALRSNVEAKLKEQGYTDSQIEEISNELESEYKRLTEYIADKALTELERRNQIPKPVNRKSDLDRLVDYHNKGLFGESAKGYERLINKIVGITKREQDVLDKIEAEIEKIKNLREVKIDGSFPDAQSIESQASYIAKSIRNIIAWSNLVNSPLKLQIITVLSDIAGISRAAVLGNLYNAFQNIYSNNRAGFLARMKFKSKGYWTPELNDAFNELKNTVTSDVLLNRGLDFGDTVSPFSNHSIFIEKIKDYINKKYPEGVKRQRAIGILNTFEGRLFLNVMDSRFKSKIVNIDFVMNLVDVLTSERAGKSKMTKEEAVNFVSESLTGVNLEKAKVLAKKFIDDVNAMKEGTLLKNEDNIKRLAFDIVRENLTSGNNFTMDEINDIYQASMKSGGINIGHESNNIVSEELKSLNNRIEKKVEDAMKEKDFDKATKYATYAFISKNILYPYMSGGLNWAVLEAEAGTPLGLATGAYKSYKNKNIDLLTDVGRKRMKEDLVNKRDAESKLFRGIWGTSIGVAAYLAYYGLQAVSGVGDDDEENKRISNKYLREHPEQRKIFDKFSPEVYAVSLAVSDERLSKYLLNKMGYKTDKNDNVLTLLKSLQNKNSSTPGALGVLLGQIVSTPGAWRILRDSKRLFRELQGEPMAQTEQRVTSFLNGYFKGALVDYLGLRPGTNYDLEKVKKEIQNKKTDFTNYTNGIANDINSGKITKEDAAKLVNKKYEDNDELLDKAKEIIQNSVNDKEIREGLKDADIWYMEMHNEKDIRAKAYIYYQNELKNNASKTDKNFDKYMDIALYGIDEDYYKKFIDLAIEYKDVEEQKSKKKPVN